MTDCPFKIVQLARTSDEGEDYFFQRIESVAEVYAKSEWEILSLSMDSLRAYLFMRTKLPPK